MGLGLKSIIIGLNNSRDLCTCDCMGLSNGLERGYKTSCEVEVTYSVATIHLQTPKEALLSTSFPVSLAQLFRVKEQLQAAAQLLTYTASLPLVKPNSKSIGSVKLASYHHDDFSLHYVPRLKCPA